MKTNQILFILLVALSTNLLAQRTESFGRFTDSGGKLIQGSSMERGYERQIYIEDLQVNTSEVIRVQITIPNDGAVTAFQTIANSKSVLPSGEITVLKLEEDRKVLYQKILMSAVKVLSVYQRDGLVSIELETSSFNQTFYTVDRNGKATSVKK